MQIHSTAIISKKAELSEGVQVGPYSVIGDGVKVGAGTKIGAHCVLEGNTTIGANCELFTGVVAGSRPQDLKYKGQKVFLDVGDNNIIREFCTLNPGTEELGRTKVGSGNLIMAYSHIAHDCVVGDSCVIANGGTLAGHVTIEDKAVIGGLVAIHQFVKVGMLSIIGGCSKVVQDIPPFSTCDGHPARVYGLNLIGLRRNNTPKESIGELARAFKMIFNSGLTPKHALEMVEKEAKRTKEITYLADFIRGTQRGVARSCRAQE